MHDVSRVGVAVERHAVWTADPSRAAAEHVRETHMFNGALFNGFICTGVREAHNMFNDDSLPIVLTPIVVTLDTLCVFSVT